MKYLKHLAWLLLIALPAAAQYGPAGNPSITSGIGFQPLGKTSAISASGTSAKIALSAVSSQVQVYNSTTASAFVIFCSSTTCTASSGSAGTSTSDYPVAPGAVIVMTVPLGTTEVAVVLASSSGTVFFTPGIGI